MLVGFGSLPSGIVADEWRVARRRRVDVQLVKIQGDPEGRALSNGPEPQQCRYVNVLWIVVWGVSVCVSPEP